MLEMTCLQMEIFMIFNRRKFTMKSYKIISGLALLSFAVIACNKEELDNNAGNEDKVNVTVTTAPELASDAIDSKTVISQDPENASLYIPSWTGNEKMGIWVDELPTSGQAQPDFLTNETVGNIATFKGSIDLTAGDHTIYGYASSADKYVAKYFNYGVGFDIPQVQYPSLTSFDSDADLLIAKAQNVNLAEGQAELSIDNVQFSRALAVLKVVLSDDSSKGLNNNAVVKTLTLTPSDANDILTGRICIDLTNNSISQVNKLSNFNVKAEYTDDSFVINGENAAWLLVNPLTFGASSTLTLEAEAGKYIINKTLDVANIELKKGDVTVFNVSLTDDDITVVESGVALPFEEDFSEVNTTSGVNSLAQFDITGSIYGQGSGAIRLGTASNPGTITTKSALDLSEPFTVIVTGTGWDDDEKSFEVVAGEQTKTFTFETEKGVNEQYDEVIYAYFEAETDITKVAFSKTGSKRVILSNIEIVSGEWTPSPELKSVETGEANTTETTAILNGTYNAAYLGDDDVVTYGFEWGTDASNLTSVTATNAEGGEFSYELTSLTTGAEYTFKAWAQLNGGDKVYGEEMTFVPTAPAYYQRTTTITSGRTYLLVVENGGTYYAATPITSNYGYIDVAEVSVEGDVIHASELASDENSYVISGTEGNYTICQSDGRYLYQTGTFNSFNVTASPSDGQYWTIEAQSDGTVKITNNSVNKFVQYDTKYNSFGSYSDESGILPYLFEKVE